MDVSIQTSVLVCDGKIQRFFFSWGLCKVKFEWAKLLSMHDMERLLVPYSQLKVRANRRRDTDLEHFPLSSCRNSFSEKVSQCGQTCTRFLTNNQDYSSTRVFGLKEFDLPMSHVTQSVEYSPHSRTHPAPWCTPLHQRSVPSHRRSVASLARFSGCARAGTDVPMATSGRTRVLPVKGVGCEVVSTHTGERGM